jgi:hypothetical protein
MPNPVCYNGVFVCKEHDNNSTHVCVNPVDTATGAAQ